MTNVKRSYHRIISISIAFFLAFFLFIAPPGFRFSLR